MSVEDGSGRINLSEERAKNLLWEMKDALIKEIGDKLDKKADLVMLNEARRTIDKHEVRLQTLEDWRTTQLATAGTLRNVSARRIGVWATGATVFVGFLTAAATLAAHYLT